MKKFLFVLIFLALHFRLYAQQFSQYNTGTLYDAFENPSQRAFITDSSRKVAFNLFFPTISTDVTLSGHAQAALKSRAFLNKYDDNALTIGKNDFNRLTANVNTYAFMLRIFTDVASKQEIGLSWQTRAEGRGVFSDESVQIVADNGLFTKASYTDIFNTHYNYQAYHQIGFSYRESIDKNFALGIKLSGLLGIVSNKVDINHSIINFDRLNDRAFLSVAGRYQASFEPGKFTRHDLLPTFRNPGASVSIGASYISPEKVKWQFNLKDLGFIHWNSKSLTGEFNNTGIIEGLSLPGVEDSVAKTASALVQTNSVPHSFTTPTNAKFEIATSKTFWLASLNAKYTPTVVISKELFYTGFNAAFVNHAQFNNFVATGTLAYNDTRQFDIGGQLMIKSPNAEFFIGCDRLQRSTSFAAASLSKSTTQNALVGPYSGVNFYIGFSIKMGSVVETRPSNASVIPLDENSGFFKRFFGRIFGGN